MVMSGSNGMRKKIRFDIYEEGAVIEGLNKLRSEKLQKNECADFINELMLKIIRTPPKKEKVRNREER